MNADLVVLHGQKVAGSMRRDDNGRVWLRYSDDYKFSHNSVPLSVTAPCGGPDYEYEVTAWIDGLLPDSESVRDRWRRENGASSADPFALLGTKIGRECAGAFRFCPTSEVASYTSDQGETRPISEYEIANWIRRARRDQTDWQLVPTGDISTRHVFSLAGAQPKLPLRLDGGQWSEPYGREPTTHILKPPVHPELPDLDVVEHVTTRAAAGLGLAAADTRCEMFDWERTLVTSRYDRLRTRDGDVVRLHQEDMCQALGLPPSKKYETDGGPGAADIAEMLRRFCRQGPEAVRQFRDALIFNWIMAGTDAHAKNYSLLFGAGPEPVLAPLYDLISYLPYASDLSGLKRSTLSMRIGGGSELRQTDRRGAWAQTSEAMGLPAEETADRIAEMSDGVMGAFTRAVDESPAYVRSSKVLAVFDQNLRRRAGRCRDSMTARPKSKGAKRSAAADNAAATAPAPALTPERCPYHGPRSKKRCVIRAGHTGPHRYRRR